MRVVLSAIETAARQHAHTFFPKISDGAGSSNTTYIVSVQAAARRRRSHGDGRPALALRTAG
jgi:hypothetical protein